MNSPFSQNSDDSELSPQYTMRIIVNLESILTEKKLKDRFIQYREIAKWPEEERVKSFVVQGASLLNPSDLIDIGILHNNEYSISLNIKSQIIYGIRKDSGLNFEVPFLYAFGMFRANNLNAQVEIDRKNEKWVGRPMLDIEYAEVSKLVEKILQNFTFLLHESLIFQITEFRKFFDMTEKVDLFKLVQDLNKEITDNFNLRMAQSFQSDNY